MGTLKVWLKNSRCEQTISWPIGAKWANQWESHTLSSYLSYPHSLSLIVYHTHVVAAAAPASVTTTA